MLYTCGSCRSSSAKDSMAFPKTCSTRAFSLSSLKSSLDIWRALPSHSLQQQYFQAVQSGQDKDCTSGGRGIFMDDPRRNTGSGVLKSTNPLKESTHHASKLTCKN